PMPNVEKLAADGVTFEHAFSCAPVCSVARTTLATGCYGPRIGTQFHRKYKAPPMPEGVRMFSAVLKQAGYYCTNRSKTDYAVKPGPGVWDMSSNKASWRNRPRPDQPFFHMESHGVSHESSLHFNRNVYETQKTSTDPASVQPAPYLPDTPLVRYTHARYHDRMKSVDGIVGQTIGKLKEDGVLEDTFVFYFGDHGGVLPRSKGYPYESGLHVPLVIRIPENFKHLVDGKRGDRVDGFVNFADFGPTAIHLAGIPLPDGIDGRPFLGKGVSMKEVNARDEAFGYADRFDEKYDFRRSLRKGRYHYIRNYQPWLPDSLNNNYRYKMLAFAEWRDLHKAGKLSGPQAQFFAAKGPEELYDVEADPHEINNLAHDSKHAGTLHDLRTRLQQKLKALPDLSFYPESKLCREAMNNPVAYGQQHKADIVGLIDTADLALQPFAEARPALEKALASKNDMTRYWAAMVCSSFGKDAATLADQVKALLKDTGPVVRMRAAEFLGLIGKQNPQPVLTDIVNTTRDPFEATEALNSIVYFRDELKNGYAIEVKDLKPIGGADVNDRINYLKGTPYPPKKKRKPKKKKT
ncbi:MAG: sulfatase-like hydrolase/transferase, partial [Verrucomicrobiota bacterium]